MATLTVGTDKQYQTVSAACAASQDGDTILVDAGTYTNDFTHITTDITLTAVGGMVNMVATIPPTDGKAIFTTDGNITINGFSFSGAAVADENGAGIRYQTGNLTINDCYFHDNEMGILGGGINPGQGIITINDSEFAFNGRNSAGGIGHNLYIGNVDTLIVTGSYFHDASVGHEIKSRAENTIITNNRIQDQNGTSSYCIDLPNGGDAKISGNVIEQGPNSENGYIIAYGEEGMTYASNNLVIDNNTILNDKVTTSSLLYNESGVPTQFTNNQVFGLALAQLPTGQTGTTFLTTEPRLDEIHLFVIACFLRGTLIQTVDGEIPVEDLAIGNLVVTASGTAQPVKWIGRRAYDPRFVDGKRHILPIRIAAGALGDGVPARDLYLSPLHAVAIDGVLVPAELLLNGTTVSQVEHVEGILEYFHVELNTHDILFAEGAASESYVDCDNRLIFANSAEYARLYPEEEGPRWAFCAPRLNGDSPELGAIRERIVKRATALGYRLSRDPEPRLVVDGKVLRPRSPSRLVHRFDIPAGAREMWLISRRTVPAYVAAGSRDIRVLGLPVKCLALLDGEGVSETWPADLALSEGFHLNEDTHCWTDGKARVPQLRPLPRRCTLEVRLAAADLRYPKSLPKIGGVGHAA